MYCKKFSATFFTKYCLYRQEVAVNMSVEHEYSNSFKKCLSCKQGIALKNKPDPIIDEDGDIRRIIREYYPKPPRYGLITLPVIKKERPPRYNLTILPEIKKEKPLRHKLDIKIQAKGL